MAEIIDFYSGRTASPGIAASAARLSSQQGTPPAEALDELQRIITMARETGEITADMRNRFMIYGLPLLGEGWQLRFTG
jgi:hypothetical protein